ncbi:MAG: hypothetical protein GC183_07640 [Thiobacillus sp.]|nr:hypothetical protein [Thiobacillus sp.]
MATKKTTPTWSDLKTRLTDFDRAGLLDLVHDLYAASGDNQAFLHARFGLGDDPLIPYKATIDRWLWPDIIKNQDTSVAKAKKAIADYRKAIGQTEGLAELMVFYCERAIGFANDVGLDDEGYYDAVVRMFEQALKTVMLLPEAQRAPFLDRLDQVRASDQNISGWVAGEFIESWYRAGLIVAE